MHTAGGREREPGVSGLQLDDEVDAETFEGLPAAAAGQMPHQGGNGLVRPPEVNWEGEPASRFPLPTLATKIRGSLLPFTTDFLIGV